MHNHFDLNLIDSKTNMIKQKCTAYNKVLDNLYNTLSSITKIYNNRIGYLFVTSNTTPMADTDITPPSPNWSGYIGLVNGQYDGVTQSIIKTASYTFNETTANANLTAVMLGFTYNTACTYAQFTDSEGHPIVITKTDNDRLTVNVTVYMTLEYDYLHEVVQLLPYSYYTTIHKITENGDLSKRCPALLYNIGNNGSQYAHYFHLSTISKFVQISNDNYLGPSYLRGNSTASNNRLTTTKILSTDCNANITYQIKGLVFYMFSVDQSSSSSLWGRPTEFISLPNHAIYPPKQLTLTAVGDGSSVDFNLGVPILLTTNVEVYINGILQPSSTYTFYGKDYTFYQAWESGDSLYMTSVDTPSNSSSLSPLPYLSNSSRQTRWNNYYYDFKNPITVSKLQSPNYITYRTDQVWYSTDNENWVQITGWGSTVYSLELDPPIQARYWKITNVQANTNVSDPSRGGVSTAFGDPKPQLRFNTAPSADSEITVKAYTEYPIKNSNWIVESMTIDYPLSHN